MNEDVCVVHMIIMLLFSSELQLITRKKQLIYMQRSGFFNKQDVKGKYTQRMEEKYGK